MKLERILYVSHRYHTNQVPVMKGWYESGVDVLFMAQYEGVSEVHDFVKFHRMKPSAATKLYNRYADSHYNASVAESKKNVAFIPDFTDVYKTIKSFRPQVVIIRNMSRGNAVICLVCKLLGIRYVINYTQTPLYQEKAEKKPLSSVAKLIYPNVSFTPVWYKGEYRKKTYIPQEWYSPHYFIPLVCDPHNRKSKDCNEGIISLLDVGKYRDYKNHFFLIDAFDNVNNKDRFNLTIIGQMENDVERDYYKRLTQYVADKQLSQYIKILGNVPFAEMNSIYSKADVLVLPSKSETAGMVILEAMASGLCVMSGNNCGLASYLEEDDCGLVFSISDPTQLTDQLDYIAENPSIIKEYGEKSIDVVRCKYGFSNYFDSLNMLMKDYYKEEINV